MPRPSRAVAIDQALLAEVQRHPRDLVRVVAERIGVTRQSAVKRANALVATGFLTRSGSTRPTYALGHRRQRIQRYDLAALAEDRVWSTDVAPLMANLARDVNDICHYGLTEMVNNAIDHSGGTHVNLYVLVDARRVTMMVHDDGVGIFRKIARHLDLPDERLALLELSKGKLTTDPAHHTGEGVFFASRVFDTFVIESGGLMFNHADAVADDFLLDLDEDRGGTTVLMGIDPASPRTLSEVFERFSSGPDEFAFDRTVVPVRLARIGRENLVSRSQAKRLLRRVDRFRRVVLDFAEIELIGQGFADEIFRVFAHAHPEVTLTAVNVAPDVAQMIVRAGGQVQIGLFDADEAQPRLDLGD